MFVIIRNRNMVFLTILCIAVTAIVKISFQNGLALTPLISNLNPSDGLPLMFGIFFGPAGVLGCTIGTFLVELFNFSLQSVFESMAVFFSSFASYKIWDLFERKSFNTPPSYKSNDASLRIALGIFTITVLTSAFYTVGHSLSGEIGPINTFIYTFINIIAANIIIGIPLFFILSLLPIINWRTIMSEKGYTGLSDKGKKQLRETYSLTVVVFASVILIAYASKFSFETDKAIGNIYFTAFIVLYLICFTLWICKVDYCQDSEVNLKQTHK